MRLPWRGRIPFALAFSLCLLSVFHTVPAGFARMATSASRAFRPDSRADWEAFGHAMPDGAKVFSPWPATSAFVFWAPRASYVNLLDPVFMVARDPDAYRLYMDVLEAREPDIPLIARARFDSDFYADDGQYPLARSRLLADPRVERLHDGITYLYRFIEGRNEDFVLDWKVLPADAPVPPPVSLIADPATRGYPRAPTERERALEAYVDGRRIGTPTACAVFARIEAVAEPEYRVLEIAPYGSGEVFVDDRPAAMIPSTAAILGRGMMLPLALDAGQHRIAIRTCPTGSHLGFYALVRHRERAPSP